MTHPLRRGLPTVVVCGVAALVAVVAAPFIGPTPLSFDRVFSTTLPFADNVDAQIFFLARLPRSLAAALVGGTLAGAGVVFQALLRNPLATPYTLGISAGASLGAMLAITFGGAVTAVLPIGGIMGASLAGAGLAVGVVYMLASARHSGLSTTVLLLAGVTLNSFFSALILLVQYLSDFTETFRALRWLMGDLDVAGYSPLVAALPLVAASMLGFAWLARPLNLLTMGADAAATRGVDVTRVQRVAFFSGSVATGAAVSVGGPIGFIGIIVPHLVRLLVGADHRLVLPASFGFGAAFLVACDVLARTVRAPLELPVGIITAMIGGPFFLYMLIARTRSR